MSRDRARLRDEWDDERPRRRHHSPAARPRRSPPPGPRRPRQAPPTRPQKRRSVWPWLLMGCAGGIVLLVIAAAAVVYVAVRSATGSSVIPSFSNPSEYTRQSPPQTIPISTIHQITVDDNLGNVTIVVDPNATSPTVTSTKKVKATSSDAANKEFDNISVQIQPPGTTADTLSVKATVPNTGGIFSQHNDTVDVTITLPPINGNTTATVPGGTTPLMLKVNVTIGNTKVTGLSGIFQIKEDVGNIDVENATLFSSPGMQTSLQTGTGNITFKGSIDTTAGSSSAQAIYSFQSETGNLDVTLPGDTNVILDAYSNAGSINSDFDLSKIKRADGSVNGPLVPGTSPTTLLKLHVSTGNISLHRA